MREFYWKLWQVVVWPKQQNSSLRRRLWVKNGVERSSKVKKFLEFLKSRENGPWPFLCFIVLALTMTYACYKSAYGMMLILYFVAGFATCVFEARRKNAFWRSSSLTNNIVVYFVVFVFGIVTLMLFACRQVPKRYMQEYHPHHPRPDECVWKLL